MKILLAIDGSPCSDAAINEVARWPWLPQCEVRVITVEAPLEPSVVKGSPTAFDELMNQRRAESARRLAIATNRLAKNAPNLRVTSYLLEGWPKDAIVSEAERCGADMVVVGSHGYGPIRRFFLGSVSLFVAHHAPCSVLIVRQPEITAPPDTLPSA